MNTNSAEVKVDFAKFAERTTGFTGGKDIVSGNSIAPQFTIPAQTLQVIELNK